MVIGAGLLACAGDAGERVVYGDSNGDTVLLLCGARELPARDLISSDNHKVMTGSATLLTLYACTPKKPRTVKAADKVAEDAPAADGS